MTNSSIKKFRKRMWGFAIIVAFILLLLNTVVMRDVTKELVEIRMQRESVLMLSTSTSWLEN